MTHIEAVFFFFICRKYILAYREEIIFSFFADFSFRYEFMRQGFSVTFKGVFFITPKIRLTSVFIGVISIFYQLCYRGNTFSVKEVINLLLGNLTYIFVKTPFFS